MLGKSAVSRMSFRTAVSSFSCRRSTSSMVTMMGRSICWRADFMLSWVSLRELNLKLLVNMASGILAHHGASWEDSLSSRSM